jgi:hypothetical protein
MQFLETTEIESKSFPNISCQITAPHQPNRFFTGLANGVIFSLTAWGFIYAMMVWMF